VLSGGLLDASVLQHTHSCKPFYNTQCNVHSLYNAQCNVHSLYYTQCNVHSLYNAQCNVHSLYYTQCNVHSLYYTQCNVHSLYNAQCNVHSLYNTVQCTLTVQRTSSHRLPGSLLSFQKCTLMCAHPFFPEPPLDTHILTYSHTHSIHAHITPPGLSLLQIRGA